MNIICAFIRRTATFEASLRRILIIMLFLPLFAGCNSAAKSNGSNVENQPVSEKMAAMADTLESSLFDYILEPWYPRCIDTGYGGYISSFEYDWQLSESGQEKALVQQARHLWTTSYVYKHYPEKSEYLDYARHGFEFIRDHYPDESGGGLYYACSREGSPDNNNLDSKTVYGQAFAVHGLAMYYEVSGDEAALELAKDVFRWMEAGPYDPEHGGYFEVLHRDGTPVGMEAGEANNSPLAGLKEFNSSLHVLEALTELYRVWPDSLVRERLEEMFYLFRDRIIHPDGYLQLYFNPDWTLVPKEAMKKRSGGSAWYTQHITFGHDVETAFLLTEAAHVLGIGNDPLTRERARALVDHSLETGWDTVNGGFFYMGYKDDGGNTTIIDDHKAFWVCSEGLNALVLMHTLYPENEKYFEAARKQWKYIDQYMIDKEYGGWYNYGLDTFPGNRTHRKSHNWKATYHDVRGMLNSVNMLRSP